MTCLFSGITRAWRAPSWAGGSLPVNPSLSYDNLGLGGNAYDRPNTAGALSYPQTRTEWFNPAAFSAPAQLAFGNAQEGAIRGPGRINFNLNLYKDFRLWNESSKLRFGAEFFNALNHTQFGGVSTTFGASNFGQVTSTYDPRTIELSLKLSF